MSNANAAAASEGPTVGLDSPEACLLADQAGIIGDLQFVMDCCKRLLSELARPEDEQEPVIPQALWSAALVAYARCFGEGKRYGLTSDDIRSLPLQGEVLKYHKWVIEQRNQVTRHPADPFDAARVGATLSPPDARPRKVAGIAIMTMSHVLVDDMGVRQLGALASELARQTAEKAKPQQDVVLADTQKMDIDHLYELPQLRTRPPGSDDQDAGAAAESASPDAG
ncbi:MAG TPA: hypothetical protein VGG35_22870 [Streptosporangiaceae bacterium]|jgi:hypothetical protein